MSKHKKSPLKLERNPLTDPKTLREHITFVVDIELRPLLEKMEPDDYAIILLLQQTRALNRMSNNGLKIRS